VSWATFQSDCDCLIIRQSVVDDVEGEILIKKNAICWLIEATKGSLEFGDWREGFSQQ
jgi:hypothetical protein